MEPLCSIGLTLPRRRKLFASGVEEEEEGGGGGGEGSCLSLFQSSIVQYLVILSYTPSPGLYILHSLINIPVC